MPAFNLRTSRSAAGSMTFLACNAIVSTSEESGIAYSYPWLHGVLGAFDQLVIQPMVTDVNAGGIVYASVQLFHSADDIHWFPKADEPEVPASPLSLIGPTYLDLGFDDGTVPSLGLVRLKVLLSAGPAASPAEDLPQAKGGSWDLALGFPGGAPFGALDSDVLQEALNDPAQVGEPTPEPIWGGFETSPVSARIKVYVTGNSFRQTAFSSRVDQLAKMYSAGAYDRCYPGGTSLPIRTIKDMLHDLWRRRGELIERFVAPAGFQCSPGCWEAIYFTAPDPTGYAWWDELVQGGMVVMRSGYTLCFTASGEYVLVHDGWVIWSSAKYRLNTEGRRPAKPTASGASGHA